MFAGFRREARWLCRPLGWVSSLVLPGPSSLLSSSSFRIGTAALSASRHTRVSPSSEGGFMARELMLNSFLAPGLFLPLFLMSG